MFGKKQPPPPGRQRPQTADRRSAVFSYHNSTSRSARPAGGGGNLGRDLQAQQRAAAQGAAAERRAGQNHWLRRTTTVVGLALLTILLVGSLFMGTTPRLEYAGDTNGNVFLRSEDTYVQAASGLLGKSLLNHTKLTAQTDKVAQELVRQFPELGTVTVRLPVFGHQPVVHVDPAVPALILTGAASQPYVLDTAGRALVATVQAPGVSKLSLPVVTDQSGLPVEAGQQALPSSTVSFITEVAGQLKAAKLTISSLTLPKGTNELDVRIEGQPYFVKFNLMDNAREESGAFLAVKQQLERDHKTPGSYIDVRVPGRAYYK